VSLTFFVDKIVKCKVVNHERFFSELFYGGGGRMAAKRPIITLLTDFGVQDHFVGVLKGLF